MQRLPVSIYAMAMLAIASSISIQSASAHQFTREATATAGEVLSVDMVQLSANFLVTAVANSGNNLEVIVWQYLPASNTLVRRGTAYSYALGEDTPVHIAALGPNNVITAAVDSYNDAHLTSFTVDANGNISEVNDVYSTRSTVWAINCAVAGLDPTHFVVWEYDQNSATYQDSSEISTWALDQWGNIMYQNSITGNVGPLVTLTKVNTGQVVTGTYDEESTPFQLESWSIDPYGNIKAQQKVTVSPSAVYGLSVASLAPGSFLTADMIPSPGSYWATEMQAMLWNVDPYSGTFTKGYSAQPYNADQVAAGVSNGTPITLSSSGFRMDAWGNGPVTLQDLATATLGAMNEPVLAQVSPGLVATGFQNSVEDLEIIVWNYY